MVKNYIATTFGQAVSKMIIDMNIEHITVGMTINTDGTIYTGIDKAGNSTSNSADTIKRVITAANYMDEIKSIANDVILDIHNGWPVMKFIVEPAALGYFLIRLYETVGTLNAARYTGSKLSARANEKQIGIEIYF